MSFREEIIGDCRLILGDCREVLPMLGPVDHVVTDPPYGVDKAEWDDKFPAADFWQLIANTTKIGASVLVFPGEAGAPDKLAAMASALDYQWVLVWYASNAMQFGKTGFTKKSLVWWFSRGNPRVRPAMPDLFEVAIIPKSNSFGHPSPKPVEVMLPLMRFAQVGDTVLDPFMGTGTTGVACAMSGRAFIGIERDPCHFETACRRIREAVAQPRLFAEPPPKPIQQSMFGGDAA